MRALGVRDEAAPPLALVVDDEEILRLFAAGLLEEHGFDVMGGRESGSGAKGSYREGSCGDLVSKDCAHTTKSWSAAVVPQVPKIPRPYKGVCMAERDLRRPVSSMASSSRAQKVGQR